MDDVPMIIKEGNHNIDTCAQLISRLPIYSIVPGLNLLVDLLKTGKTLYEFRIAYLVRKIIFDINKLPDRDWENIIRELNDHDEKIKFGAAMYDILFETRRQSDAEFFSFLLLKRIVGDINTDQLIHMKSMTEKLIDIHLLKDTVELLAPNANGVGIARIRKKSIHISAGMQELYLCGALIQKNADTFGNMSGPPSSRTPNPLGNDPLAQYSDPIYAYTDNGAEYIKIINEYLKK